MPTLPSDQVVHVAALLAVAKAEHAARSAGAAAIGDDMHVAARHEEIALPCLDDAQRRTGILDLPRVRRGGDEHRIAARLRWAQHVRQQADAVAHQHRDVIVLHHGILRLR